MVGKIRAYLCAIGLLLQAAVAAPQTMDHVHFIVPTGAGGGWDSTARGVGLVLRDAGLIDRASFENVVGAGGGKGIATMVESAQRNSGTLLVNSTPIIVRSLTKLFPYSFRDLTPIARVIGDYQAFAVRPDSELSDFADVVRHFRDDPRSVKVVGGSVRGDLDHLVPALALRAAGEDPKKLVYVPYAGGGRAVGGFLTGEGDVLSSGLGELLTYHRAGKLRIIGVSAPQPLTELPDLSTLHQQGIDFDFVNWRGFFAAPGIAPELADEYAAMLERMLATPEWEAMRARNGWQNLYLGRQAFGSFLDEQEDELRVLMMEMGFLRPQR